MNGFCRNGKKTVQRVPQLCYNIKKIVYLKRMNGAISEKRFYIFIQKYSFERGGKIRVLFTDDRDRRR